jgi:ribosomal biogenesis protein LAS1
VNGIVEGSQKGFFARPIAAISSEIGLPAYIVELRHDATHKHLPSLAVLRHACQESVQWLYSNYWLKQYNAITNIR